MRDEHVRNVMRHGSYHVFALDYYEAVVYHVHPSCIFVLFHDISWKRRPLFKDVCGMSLDAFGSTSSSSYVSSSESEAAANAMNRDSNEYTATLIDSSDSSMDDDDVALGPWPTRRLRKPSPPADHGARYGLQHLYGYRHPTSPSVADDAHGAFMAAKRWDETQYRCCVFYDGAEIRFRYNYDGAELQRQVKRLTDRGWAVMREPSDVYVTTHGTGLPSGDRPFWRRGDEMDVGS